MQIEKLTQKFISGLRNNKFQSTFIYWNLFSILEKTQPDFLKHIIDEYKKNPEDYFRVFHKSLRQCEFFGDDYVIVERRPLSEDEQKRHDELLNLRNQVKEKYRGLGPEELDKIYDNPEFTQYDTEWYLLRRKKNRQHIMEDGHIGGHLDSIFWQTISNDNKEDLYQYMNDFLKLNVKL